MISFKAILGWDKLLSSGYSQSLNISTHESPWMFTHSYKSLRTKNIYKLLKQQPSQQWKRVYGSIWERQVLAQKVKATYTAILHLLKTITKLL